MQHDYGVGIEVRSLLSTEELQEVEGRLAVVDVVSSGNRFVRFWVDSPLDVPMEERTTIPVAGEHVEARDYGQGRGRSTSNA